MAGVLAAVLDLYVKDMKGALILEQKHSKIRGPEGFVGAVTLALQCPLLDLFYVRDKNPPLFSLL